MPVAIAILLLRSDCRTICRILGQQFAAKTVDLPGLRAVDDALDALAASVINVELRLVVAAPG